MASKVRILRGAKIMAELPCDTLEQATAARRRYKSLFKTHMPTDVDAIADYAAEWAYEIHIDRASRSKSVQIRHKGKILDTLPFLTPDDARAAQDRFHELQRSNIHGMFFDEDEQPTIFDVLKYSSQWTMVLT
jgi:hypothetical protein